MEHFQHHATRKEIPWSRDSGICTDTEHSRSLRRVNKGTTRLYHCFRLISPPVLHPPSPRRVYRRQLACRVLDKQEVQVRELGARRPRSLCGLFFFGLESVPTQAPSAPGERSPVYGAALAKHVLLRVGTTERLGKYDGMSVSDL